MLAYARGDTAAFDALYQRHRGPLYRFLQRGLRNRASADEAYQEVWARVIAARARYQPTATFRTWLFQVAHNLMVDSYRKRRAEDPDADLELALERGTGPEHERPEAQLTAFEEHRRLQRALQALPDEQRIALQLRLEQELSLEEIARITGTGRETVKSRLRYAMDKLRTTLTA
jgi:RNA polymerase sigma-70 factor (ECF subfamily)